MVACREKDAVVSHRRFAALLDAIDAASSSSTHPLVRLPSHEAIVLAFSLSRQEPTDAHTDGSTDEFCETSEDDEARRSYARQASGECKGHCEAVAVSRIANR